MTEQDDRQARLDEAVDKIRDAAHQLVEAFARLGEAAMKALRAVGEMHAIWLAAWPVARRALDVPVAFVPRPHADGPAGPVRTRRTGWPGRGQVP